MNPGRRDLDGDLTNNGYIFLARGRNRGTQDKMPSDNFTVTVDDTARLMTIRVRGGEPGSHYAAKYMEAYAAIDRPWTYARLLDHRHFKGIMSFDQVTAMARQWADLTRGVGGNSRAAVLTRDPLATARINSLRALYPNVDIQVFSRQADALEWLGVYEVA